MAISIDTLATVLRLEFVFACLDLARARARQRRSDTPAHRAAVANILARIDSVLDMHLDAGTDHRATATAAPPAR